MEYELVQHDLADGIATLTLNRPKAMNALNDAPVEALTARLRSSSDDPAAAVRINEDRVGGTYGETMT